jgi:hypothetical protein
LKHKLPSPDVARAIYINEINHALLLEHKKSTDSPFAGHSSQTPHSPRTLVHTASFPGALPTAATVSITTQFSNPLFGLSPQKVYGDHPRESPRKVTSPKPLFSLRFRRQTTEPKPIAARSHGPRLAYSDSGEPSNTPNPLFHKFIPRDVSGEAYQAIAVPSAETRRPSSSSSGRSRPAPRSLSRKSTKKKTSASSQKKSRIVSTVVLKKWASGSDIY